MSQMKDIFYSGTFAGETSSLNACEATIDFLIKNNSIKKNIQKGEFFRGKINKIIKKYNLENIISLEGHSSWIFLVIKNTNKKINSEVIKIFIRQELIKRKILFLGSFNITHSHTHKNLSDTIKVIENIFSFISKNFVDLERYVYIKLQKNIFEVRKSTRS